MSKVLILDQSKSMRNTLRERLEFEGFSTETVEDEVRAAKICEKSVFDVIIADSRCKVPDTGAPFIVVSADNDLDSAVEALKRGAVDFLTKPVDMNRLLDTLRKTVDGERRETPAATPRARRHGPSADAEPIIGASEAVGRVRKLIDKVAKSDARVLITGENGTGKDVLAREIHAQSLRSGRPMVAVDAGAITETLFESELFGHVKGAFTDARSDHAGKFEQADGGTLFLDEIGNIPLHLQAKLLRALQNRSVVPVGGTAERPVDIRLICATNMDLEQLVREGRFREDLYYRINTVHINLPPLRERRDDIVPLAERFIAEFAERYHRQVAGLDDYAKEALTLGRWNGNIRELQNVVEKAVIMSEGRMLSRSDILTETMQPGAVQMRQAVGEDEERMVREAMERAGWNVSAAAKMLGISRPTLYAKLKKYKL